MGKRPNYRITFHDGPLGKNEKKVDVYAENSRDAFKQAYEMPEAKNRVYTGILVSAIPEGPSVIGIMFKCKDTSFNETTSNYIFIKANSEKEAADYYNRKIRGKRFRFYPKDIDRNGRFVFEEIQETYFAAGTDYTIDATA